MHVLTLAMHFDRDIGIENDNAGRRSGRSVKTFRDDCRLDAFSSICACSNACSDAGSMRINASSRLMRCSLTMSAAICTAAAALRLPDRHCST